MAGLIISTWKACFVYFFVNMSSPIQTFASEIGLTEKFRSNQHEVHFDQTSENMAQILLEIITRYSMQDSPLDE
jgi:hypothetical protein